ncbi:MAG TPA: tRNA lysidine(34) synthetase TilS [Allosphingosinicella sp.]|nr:tRNA lysidine(34) synthetase TilS [Allosphingosinicella sp.]
MIDPHLASRFRRDVEAAAGRIGQPFAVAVSGGPDSLALLLLAGAAFPGKVRAATVDHGLRPEARAEAEAVAALCAIMAIPHAILSARVQRKGEGLQAAARDARYRALAAWMDEESLALIVTGHHQDDQAETMLMRLNRGSGVGGLAGIREQGPVPGAPHLRLARPLLGWRRDELAEVVGGAGIETATDPSNLDPAYDRARLRAGIVGAEWLNRAGLAKSAALVGEADEALTWAAQELFCERAEVGRDAISLRAVGVPPELLRRLVLACLRGINPDAAPRGDKLSVLIEALQEGRAGTLAGVKAEPRGGRWSFAPAPPRLR